jgi:uncharacterized damage-inducible protein DinB
MNAIEQSLDTYAFHRARTLSLLDKIDQESDPQAVLSWRPGEGRAHIGWQLMHVGITEEIFAAERLAQKHGTWTDLWPRFRGGSTPEDTAPQAAQIREVLEGSRAHLHETLRDLEGIDLESLPVGWKDRGLSIRQVLALIGWHEAHHQGQAHITYNLYRAARG